MDKRGNGQERALQDSRGMIGGDGDVEMALEEELFDVRAGANQRSRGGSKRQLRDRGPHDDALPPICPHQSPLSLARRTGGDAYLAPIMSEKQKGISLRKKRGDKPKKGAPPTISAPRQISAPMPAGAGIGAGIGAATLPGSARPSNESSRSRSRGDVPQQRPQRADKTADLVKRRYSQKIMTLPTDFGNGEPMPDMPQIPMQYREKSQTRDGRPPGSSDGRALKVDMMALRDPNLRAEQCMLVLLCR